MKMPKQKDSGFTLVEMLLGVTISVMIFLAAGSVIALMFRTDLKSKNKESLEQAKNDLQTELTTAIRWGQEITFSEGLLIIDDIRYSLEDKRIKKGDTAITSENINVTRFSIDDSSNSPTLKSLEVNIDMENAFSNNVKDTLKIAVSQRKTTFEEQ